VNEQAAAARAAGGAAGVATGGPVAGLTWMNEGSSGSSELVKLPSGSWVLNARQTQQMLGNGSSNISVNITVNGTGKDQIKNEVMKALDSALVSASFGGGYIGSGSYVPNG
jgi:hypothetical protein